MAFRHTTNMLTVEKTPTMRNAASIEQDVIQLLDEVLELGGRGAEFNRDTLLLGVLPELDSMAVVGVLNMLEERFGFIVGDDEIDGTAFESVGSLADFVCEKLGA